MMLFSETETAKQNQKFPFHFLSAPPTPPAEEKKKGKENFWVLPARVRERVRGALVRITTQSERTRQFQATTRSARAKLVRVLLEMSSNFFKQTPQEIFEEVLRYTFGMRDIFKRSAKNPILKPNPDNTWEAVKVYNPGAVYFNNEYHLFYRAIGFGQEWHSAIGYAVSGDGENFKRSNKPILDRDTNNALELRGLEDPRITQIEDTFYMVYAAYDGKVPRINIATSKDLRIWQKHGQALNDFDLFKNGGMKVRWENGKPIDQDKPRPDRTGDRSKAGAMFSEKINGKYWMVFNEFKIWLAHSSDGIQWDYIPKPFLEPRRGTDFFDNVFVETGPPPIKTEKGWLVLYHGINDTIQYHLGILLLDLEDPTKILFRSDEPVFGPKESYELSGIVDIIPGAIELLEQGKNKELNELLKNAEKEGFMPQVTFTTAAVVVGDTLRLFYGAGDQFICTATTSMKEILSLLPD